LGSLLSVLCVPSILVLHKDPLFRTSRVPLRRSRLYDPCNTLLFFFFFFFRLLLSDPCNPFKKKKKTSAVTAAGAACLHFQLCSGWFRARVPWQQASYSRNSSSSSNS
jgi:hypothetical protein